MKKLMLALLLVATTALASNLPSDGNGYSIQGAAPNGFYSAILTASTTHDLTNYIWWGVYCAADCKGRLMSTSAKGSYPQFTIPGGSWYGELRNSATPFVNISGAHEWKQQ